MDFTALQQSLLSWFQEHRRPLPWREEYDPYQIWISEIMAQQTQMDRVVLYFQRWMAALPDIAAVAAADEQVILKLWEGLGYYSRARNIQRCARVLLAEHGGRVPDRHEALLALPGIGPYTAAAILSIGYNLPFPLVDANVLRIASRLIDIDTPIARSSSRRQAESFVRQTLADAAPREVNQALMELGALVCTPKNPACDRCPLQSFCRAYRIDAVDMRPVPGKKTTILRIDMACALICHQGRYFIQQRLPDDVWPNLWEFPGGRLQQGEDPAAAAVREVLEETGLHVRPLGLLQTVRHSYTRYRITLHGYRCALLPPFREPLLQEATQYRWLLPEELDSYPFPAGHRQFLPLLRFPEFRKISG